MTLEQLEQRVTALEQTVAEIRSQSNGAPLNGASRQGLPARERLEGAAGDYLKEEDIPPGCEIIFIPTEVPPNKVYHFTGKLVAVEREPETLALTDEEWNLYGGGDDEGV